jgi:hypothetical protein
MRRELWNCGWKLSAGPRVNLTDLAIVIGLFVVAHPVQAGTQRPAHFVDARGHVHVPDNASLMAASTAAYSTGIWRDDFSAGMGAPSILYVPSSSPCGLNSGNGDNASQVRSADGKCWIAQFKKSPPDARQWGANSTDDSAAALAAADAAGFGVGIYSEIRVETSLTLKSPITFGAFGKLHSAAGAIITLRGKVVADLKQQIFNDPAPLVNLFGQVTAGSPTITGIIDTSAVVIGALVTGPGIPAGARVLSKTLNSITLDKDCTLTVPGGSDLSLQPVTAVIDTTANNDRPIVSAAWFGALAAARTGADAMPALRSVAGSNRTIYLPPLPSGQSYTCRSRTASPYPPVTGVGNVICLDWNELRNFKLLGAGARITTVASTSNAILLLGRYWTDADVGNGLHFLAHSANVTASIGGNVLKVAAAPAPDSVAVGASVTGANVAPGTYVIELGTGTGEAGTYIVNKPQNLPNQVVTIGLPCCEPTGLLLVNGRRLHVHDIHWDGNWGGSTKRPAALGVAWLMDSEIYDLYMPTVALCADTAFLFNTHWYNIYAEGAPDSGMEKYGSSGSNCFNVERDTNFLGYYPAIGRDAGYVTSRNNTFGPNIHIRNFAAGFLLRAGSHYRVIQDDLSDNPGVLAGAGGAAGHELGAGVYVLFDTRSGVQTYSDPVSDLLIVRNRIYRNGEAGTNAHSVCDLTSTQGAGVIVDSSCVGTTSAKTLIANARGLGNAVQFQRMSVPGWIALNEVPIEARDLTNPIALAVGTRVRSADLFAGRIALSSPTGNVNAGDTILFLTSGYKLDSATDITIVNNIFGDNMTAGVLAIDPMGLLRLRVTQNEFLGVRQIIRFKHIPEAQSDR